MPDNVTDALEELAMHIEQKRSRDVVSYSTAYKELTLEVIASSIDDLVDFLRTDNVCRFSTLVDITAIDYPQREKRFDVVYHLLSMYQNHRIRLKISVFEGQMVPTLSNVHPSANWFEREVFDMFGIVFSGHPDLRRLLTDYGFSGHPLRRDFPATGYTELCYDEAQKRVVYEPVKLVQEYRQFDFMSPWEGIDGVLPGDEKKDTT